ncbi:MAG: hypothetical protein RR192_02400 [Peptostreptococcaceae bacterium]
MTENIKLEIIKGTVTLVTTFITAVGAYWGTKHFRKNKSSDKIKLSSHPIFAKVEFNKNVILAYFKLENKGKEVVFREILVTHMDVYKSHTMLLCNKLENEEISEPNELYNYSVIALGNIVTDLRQFYKTDNRFTDGEKQVLDIVMSKYNHWNYDREREILSRIQEVCGSAFYPDVYTKAVTVLDAFLFAMNDTVSDANKTLNSINGDLQGLKFRGVVI